ncbi:oligoendopeptidase F [Sphingomonas oleivorans]|uniref:Oligopeptidase F n=1 Tax=Sphingomonas oleivorans TaxID=1735121 RepID=A0A2T5FYW3_9SPHN|nr:oligoendopeptidase F [Sphingomonas oleivorans]PTQ11684.1 oligoendopeptidase F [Sphingomonas oleivorans]
MTDISRRDLLLSAGTFAALAAANPALAAAEAGTAAAWDLTELYPTDAEWNAAREAAAKAVPGLLRYKGMLGGSAATLKAALQAISDLSRQVYRIYVYASLKADEDLRVAVNQERRQQVTDLATALGEATAWFNPELLAVGKPKIDGFLAADPGLAKCRFGLEDVLRQAPHTLGEEGEGIIAAAGTLQAAPQDIRGQIVSSDMPRAEVTLSTGVKATLDDQGYTMHRDAPDRADRKLVFDNFWQSYGKFESALGAALAARIKGDMFAARARKYGNSLEAALSADNIPETVYRTLVAETNRGLPVLHRYFELRRRMLKLPDMHYYDIYPPLVSLDRKFTLPEMRAITLEALKPLGKPYADQLARATAAKWMDPLPRKGKRSGAYMNPGAYDVHPYLLLNLSENYDGLTTYAHEWGHAMHSLLANAAQPFETANYSIFTAEIASTCNEQILVQHMLERAKTREEKLFYLGQQMESFRGTFFRQAMFAEFELAIHDLAEKGEGLSGARFTAIYLDLLKKYHGPKVEIDPAYAIEWAYINHFYMNFYVFKYATSIAGAVYFAQDIAGGGAAARDRYLAVLKAGGSDYPTEILKRAGLDMATPAPYRALVSAFDRTLDQAEALLAG